MISEERGRRLEMTSEGLSSESLKIGYCNMKCWAMLQMGQNAKNSPRAYVVRSTPDNARRADILDRQLHAMNQHMQCSKTALLFDHVVCALLQKSSLPCSLDCAE